MYTIHFLAGSLFLIPLSFGYSGLRKIFRLHVVFIPFWQNLQVHDEAFLYLKNKIISKDLELVHEIMFSVGT